jgi:high-affinity iron transporter
VRSVAIVRAWLRFVAVAAAVACASPIAFAQQPTQTILHLLDYIGVDYAGAVKDGRVISADEYQEMTEFAAQVSARLKELPDNPAKRTLAASAEDLRKLVATKAAPATVSAAAGKLRWAMVDAYKLRLAPRSAPSVERGRALYAQNCAACHGAQGHGDGPAAKGLDPAPSDFHDRARMVQRSVYGLYNTITLGVNGTSMASFAQLSEEDRWALAFFVSNIGVPPEQVREGQRLWAAGEGRKAITDLEAIATVSGEEIEARHGAAAARIQDYLRAHPEVLRPPPLAYAKQKLGESRTAYARGDATAARQTAISAYLEGFELVENALANVDMSLMKEIEREMIDLRAAIERAEAAWAYSARTERVEKLLDTATETLSSGEMSPGSSFAASLFILLREGLEAILVLAAILAFVRKTGRRDALPWVHAGWVIALMLGAVTWFVAAYVVDITGADRELTEGVTALLAAGMLLYVGFWLHARSHAQAWSRFIRDQVGQALGRRTLWAMAAVSFLAVYREVFEVVLFYEALWAQAGPSGHDVVVAGIVVAAVLLAVIGFAIFRYSLRLPTALFFSATSGLLALLAVIFTGHGVAALQEAGVVRASHLGFDAVPLLGLYPSGETLAAQFIVVVAIAVGYWMSNRSVVPVERAQ